MRDINKNWFIVAIAIIILLVGAITWVMFFSPEPKRDMEDPVPLPQEMNLTSPEAAVRSYLAWVTYAYRTMNSEIATPTMTPDEASRISYYITANRSEDKILNQRLDSLKFSNIHVSDAVATVIADEAWIYNYQSEKTGNFDELQTVEYEATYTLILVEGMWKVQSVDAAEK